MVDMETIMFPMFGNGPQYQITNGDENTTGDFRANEEDRAVGGEEVISLPSLNPLPRTQDDDFEPIDGLHNSREPRFPGPLSFYGEAMFSSSNEPYEQTHYDLGSIPMATRQNSPNSVRESASPSGQNTSSWNVSITNWSSDRGELTSLTEYSADSSQPPVVVSRTSQSLIVDTRLASRLSMVGVGMTPPPPAQTRRSGRLRQRQSQGSTNGTIEHGPMNRSDNSRHRWSQETQSPGSLSSLPPVSPLETTRPSRIHGRGRIPGYTGATACTYCQTNKLPCQRPNLPSDYKCGVCLEYGMPCDEPRISQSGQAVNMGPYSTQGRGVAISSNSSPRSSMLEEAQLAFSQYMPRAGREPLSSVRNFLIQYLVRWKSVYGSSGDQSMVLFVGILLEHINGRSTIEPNQEAAFQPGSEIDDFRPLLHLLDMKLEKKDTLEKYRLIIGACIRFITLELDDLVAIHVQGSRGISRGAYFSHGSQHAHSEEAHRLYYIWICKLFCVFFKKESPHCTAWDIHQHRDQFGYNLMNRPNDEAVRAYEALMNSFQQWIAIDKGYLTLAAQHDNQLKTILVGGRKQRQYRSFSPCTV